MISHKHQLMCWLAYNSIAFVSMSTHTSMLKSTPARKKYTTAGCVVVTNISYVCTGKLSSLISRDNISVFWDLKACPSNQLGWYFNLTLLTFPLLKPAANCESLSWQCFYTLTHSSWRLRVLKENSGQVSLIFSGLSYKIWTQEHFLGAGIDELSIQKCTIPVCVVW